MHKCYCFAPALVVCGHLLRWLQSGHFGSFWTVLPSRIFRLLNFSPCWLILCLLPDLSLSAGLWEKSISNLLKAVTTQRRGEMRSGVLLGC